KALAHVVLAHDGERRERRELIADVQKGIERGVAELDRSPAHAFDGLARAGRGRTGNVEPRQGQLPGELRTEVAVDRLACGTAVDAVGGAGRGPSGKDNEREGKPWDRLHALLLKHGGGQRRSPRIQPWRKCASFAS